MAEILNPEKQNVKVFQKKKLIRVDMTPMVDLGFLLITFFMFTTNFTKPNVLDLSLPAKPQIDKKVIACIDLSNSITFIIGKENRIFYHQKDAAQLDENSLKEISFNSFNISKTIEAAKKNAKDPNIFTVIIKPTDDANYKNFVDILDEMSISNSDRFGITEIKNFEKKIYEKKVK